MSSVYERDRALSKWQWYVNAQQIRTEVERLVTSRSFPKSYRFVFAVPMCEEARTALRHIVWADRCVPHNPGKVAERKRHLRAAANGYEMLFQDLQDAKRLQLPVKLSKIDDLIDMLDEEIALLTDLEGKVKVVTRGKGGSR